MRHHNSYGNSPWRRRQGEKITRPYQHEYIDSYNRTKFATANSKKRYVQILQFVADHDNCKRVDIMCSVWKFNAKMPSSRGFWSGGFSQLLYIDVIDYDKNFRYHITDKGREVLKTAYLNDMAKFVKGN